MSRIWPHFQLTSPQNYSVNRSCWCKSRRPIHWHFLLGFVIFGLWTLTGEVCYILNLWSRNRILRTISGFEFRKISLALSIHVISDFESSSTKIPRQYSRDKLSVMWSCYTAVDIIFTKQPHTAMTVGESLKERDICFAFGNRHTKCDGHFRPVLRIKFEQRIAWRFKQNVKAETDTT